MLFRAAPAFLAIMVDQTRRSEAEERKVQVGRRGTEGGELLAEEEVMVVEVRKGTCCREGEILSSSLIAVTQACVRMWFLLP